MSKDSFDVSGLSHNQRALLELQLNKRGGASAATDKAPAHGGRDDENLVLAESSESVDELLGEFYGRFPWPWQPTKFVYLDDPQFEVGMLNQDLGDWEGRTIPSAAEVWVAGCGTNQALHTALRLPEASVIGSDVSAQSLALCGNNAQQLGVGNLELRRESLNHVTYERRFDYVISTGVIHHNADPAATLRRLVAALKPGGILELMVYNRFHRTLTSAFQKAVRILGGGAVNFEADLSIARKLAANFPVSNQLSALVKQYEDGPESDFADLLIHPVEHSYTVDSLRVLAADCGLELLYPCISLYAKFLAPTVEWNLELGDPELQDLYCSLPDASRWQVTNLLLHEKSPLLWFYFQRQDARRRKSEAELCAEFLDRTFRRSAVKQLSYVRGADGRYELSPRALPYPLAPPEATVREVYAAVDGVAPMRDILRRLNIEPTFQRVNHIRTMLATSAYPYLQAT